MVERKKPAIPDLKDYPYIKEFNVFLDKKICEGVRVSLDNLFVLMKEFEKTKGISDEDESDEE